jgi:hypothetical protein
MELSRLLRTSEPWPGPRPTDPRTTYAGGTDEPSTQLDNWIVGLGACIFFLLAAALASQVAPRRASRLRHFSTREAVLALCGVTAVCCAIAILGTFLACLHPG